MAAFQVNLVKVNLKQNGSIAMRKGNEYAEITHADAVTTNKN